MWTRINKQKVKNDNVNFKYILKLLFKIIFLYFYSLKLVWNGILKIGFLCKLKIIVCKYNF